MGTTVLAQPAMRRARAKLGAELYFVIFARNVGSLDLTGEDAGETGGLAAMPLFVALRALIRAHVTATMAEHGWGGTNRETGFAEARGYLDDAEALRSWSNFGGRSVYAAWTAGQAQLVGYPDMASVVARVLACRLTDEDWLDIIDDVTHCPAYYQLLVKSLLLPGLQELAEGSAPTHLVICEKDHVLPHPRFTRHFTKHLPEATEITHLDAVGHIPMFEAPQRVADLIVSFVDRYATPPPHQAIS